MSADEEDWDPDGLAYDLEVARGMLSNRTSKRTSTETIWRAIAEGTAHVSTATCWVEYVARQLVDGLIDKHGLNDKLRGREALRALGLYDKGDRYAYLRSLIDIMMGFRDLDGPEPAAAPRPKDILSSARERGLFEGIDDRRAIECVRRQLNNVIERRSHFKG